MADHVRHLASFPRNFGASFGIFDTFKTEEGRTAHVTGPIAKALFARAEELFDTPPQVEMLEILALKAPAA